MIPWNDNNSPSLQPKRRGGRRRHTIHTIDAGQSTTTPTNVVIDDNEDIYGYERGLTYDHPPLPPVEAMSPERRARKQRIRPAASRRGGACHSDLLKSAVLATLEAEEELNMTPNSSTSVPRRHSAMDATTAMMMMTPGAMAGMDDSQRNNPRKRARNGMDCEEEGVLEECLLGAMDFCSISAQTHYSQQQQHSSTGAGGRVGPMEPPVVRHVARRRSKELACGIVPSPRTNGECESS